MSELDQYRREKDEFFRLSHHSPLTHPQRKNFAGLKYFPEDPELRFEVEVEEFDQKQSIAMQTTTGDVQEYERFGRFSFAVEGTPAVLTIFANEHGYFIPFVDALAGKETYGAGRYLEPEVGTDGKFQVDFNLAYNPFCAYNENYSCPITPFENRIKVPVRAGERVFTEDE